jgi:hypothetical protein
MSWVTDIQAWLFFTIAMLVATWKVVLGIFAFCVTLFLVLRYKWKKDTDVEITYLTFLGLIGIWIALLWIFPIVNVKM